MASKQYSQQFIIDFLKELKTGKWDLTTLARDKDVSYSTAISWVRKAGVKIQPIHNWEEIKEAVK